MSRGSVVAIVLVILLAGAALFAGSFLSNEQEDESPAVYTAMVKSAVIPEGSSPPIGPYTPAVRVGHMLFLSGQLGINPVTGQMVEGGTVPQARQAMSNLRSLLQAAGMSFDNVVRATVYLADLDDYEAFNEEYGKYFGEVPPARVCIQVARIPRDARVEISMIAVGDSN